MIHCWYTCFRQETPAFGGDQAINWFGLDSNETNATPRLPLKAYGDDDFTLNAEASSGLPVVYSILKVTGNW